MSIVWFALLQFLFLEAGHEIVLGKHLKVFCPWKGFYRKDLLSLNIIFRGLISTVFSFEINLLFFLHLTLQDVNTFQYSGRGFDILAGSW